MGAFEKGEVELLRRGFVFDATEGAPVGDAFAIKFPLTVNLNQPNAVRQAPACYDDRVGVVLIGWFPQQHEHNQRAVKNGRRQDHREAANQLRDVRSDGRGKGVRQPKADHCVTDVTDPEATRHERL